MPEENKREVKPIVKGKVHEKNLGEKAAEAFLSEDTRTVKNYILWDVIVPAIKNTLADVVIGGIEMVLFGSSRGSRNRTQRGGATRVSYTDYYEGPSNGESNSRVGDRFRDDKYSYSDILLDTRGEAEDVITTMEELIDRYGEATVADLYSLVGVAGRPHTDNKWGWSDKRDLSYRRSGRGYVLDFAKPIYLGN